MEKKLYSVKIEFAVWYDRIFDVEAYDELEAEVKVREMAKKQTLDLAYVDLPVENDGAWTYGDQDYDTVYVRLEK